MLGINAPKVLVNGEYAKAVRNYPVLPCLRKAPHPNQAFPSLKGMM